MKVFKHPSEANCCALVHLRQGRPLSAGQASHRRTGLFGSRLGRPTSGPSSRVAGGLQRPDTGIDVKLLQKKSAQLGLAPEAANELIEYANLLASQRLLSSTVAAQVQVGRAEARYSKAEARYGKAERRTAQAFEKVAAGLEEKHRLQSLAKDKYLALVELRGSVNLRDELRQILSEGAAELSAAKDAAKQPRPSALKTWSSIFALGQGDSPSVDPLPAMNDRYSGRETQATRFFRRPTPYPSTCVHRDRPCRCIETTGAFSTPRFVKDRTVRELHPLGYRVAQRCPSTATSGVNRGVATHRVVPKNGPAGPWALYPGPKAAGFCGPLDHADGLLNCCRRADGRLNSPAKAAAAMVVIGENSDKRVHRSLPAEVVKRLGGIAIEESPLLGSADCKLIECVLNWAMMPCKIVAKEEVDAAIARHVSR